MNIVYFNQSVSPNKHIFARALTEFYHVLRQELVETRALQTLAIEKRAICAAEVHYVGPGMEHIQCMQPSKESKQKMYSTQKKHQKTENALDDEFRGQLRVVHDFAAAVLNDGVLF